ncbi:MAG: protein phosphatase 2C domain-containing protein [Candidatus Babeliaceae bacterium]|nr:protein phosphatase 2C domain-containing protein [Candidatus Babeliaceae bacterium]
MKKVFLALGFLALCKSSHMLAWVNTAGAHNDKTIVGISQAQGLRNSMEDAHYVECNDTFAFFGLYDGHGGPLVANFAAQNLHKNVRITDIYSIPGKLHEAFVKTHGELDSLTLGQGCTALVACIHHDILFIANAGDSRAVLCNNGVAIPLSIDHKPDRCDERKRIELLGGIVTTYFSDAPRVNGQLAVSRALGDKALNPFVIPDPEITQRKLTHDDEFLILACDGVWDVIENQQAIDTIKSSLARGYNCQEAADALKDQALVRGSTDNISVIIVNLK